MGIENPGVDNKKTSTSSILKTYRDFVWPEIKSYLQNPIYPKGFSIPNDYREEENSYWKIVRDYPERQGKYLRPTFLILTAEAMGVEKQKTIKTAAAMQVSEDWLLIHDDFEDNSLERRGRPTLHKIYGPELAVNAGDALQIIMWKILSDNRTVLGSKRTFQLEDEFHRILIRTTLGQNTEIEWARKNKTDFSDKDWFFICDGKTSYYTIAGPMRLGAIMANANSKELGSITEFGINLGRCFQLVDDVLDLTSDFSGLKKQTGNDIYEGKRTVILGHLLRTSGVTEKNKIISILAKPLEEKKPEEVLWILNQMQQHGSLEYAINLAEEHGEKAKKIFEEDLTFLSAEPARTYLGQLITFILERKY